MPYKFETDKKLIPREKKKTVKLSLIERDYIKENPDCLSKHQLALKFNVSRRLIQFIMHPERYTKNLEDRQKRGGSKIYYKKEIHTKNIREYRKHKKELDTQDFLI